VQGSGAALVLPLTLTLIIDAFPTGRRGVAIGIWGGVTGLGVAAGPVVGGTITSALSWQWIFWVNVPIGLVVAVLSALRLRESHGPRAQLDIPGLVLVGIGLFGLTWAAVRAPAAGWGSAEVIGALAGGALLLGAFAVWERRTATPMLPFGYFRRRGFAAANAVAFLQQVSILGAAFMLSQLFQVGLGYSPVGAGLRIVVWTGTLMLVAPLAGALSDRFGNRPFMTLGMAVQAAGFAWVAWEATYGVQYTSLILPLIVAGVGISMGFPTVANMVTGSVPIEDAGVAAGTNSSMRELGNVFGVALTALVFANYGGYGSPRQFIEGFRPAMLAAAGFALLAVIPAALGPGGVINVHEDG
jgi:EmrB/QacA subfamily drug resistance transporter